MDATGPMFPTPEVSIIEPPHIVTLEELMSSHAVIVAQEANDRATLNPLVNPTREAYRPQLFAWAAGGFLGGYIVQTIPLTPPSVCSDGVTRNVYDYVVYLLGQDMGTTITGIQALCIGVLISYSISGNALRIHVNKG